MNEIDVGFTPTVRVMNWPDAPMYEARITTHINFGICVGQRGP
jgi:hypothetical protein